ncbi:MAG: phosphonate ABC transporter substrate-binding protein [Burkholderiaceae bacterium]
MKRRVFLSSAVLVAAIAASAHAKAAELNFGIISTESTQNLKANWTPLLADMQKATGIKVNAFFAPDYAGIIEAMRFNKVQVAWFGNKSAIEAVDRSNGEVFAKTVGKDGTEGYYSLIVVRNDSKLKSLDEVLAHRKELKFGFGDPNSTSGTVVPGYYAFALNKIDPVKDFKRTVRSNHETNRLAVVSGQVDAATNNTENLERFSRSHPDKAKMVREVWRSPIIPSDPLVWRKDLDPAMKAKVRDFLLAYGKGGNELKVLHGLNLGGFKSSSDRQLVTIRQLELVKAKTKLQADKKLAAEERDRRIREIESKLDALREKVAKK